MLKPDAEKESQVQSPWELIYRLLREKPTAIIVGVIVPVLVLGTLVVGIINYRSLEHLFVNLRDGPCLQTKRRPHADFALFEKQWPRTQTGQPFNYFSDEAFNGKSTCFMSVKNHDGQADHFLRLHFSLDDKQKLMDAYAGVFAEWSSPPGEVVDLSQYKGIALQARLKVDNGDVGKMKALVSVGMDSIRDYAYHEYDFSNQLSSSGETMLHNVKVPFSQLQTPDWSLDKREFDPRSVFRVSIFVKGKDQEGELDIDNIRFY